MNSFRITAECQSCPSAGAAIGSSLCHYKTEFNLSHMPNPLDTNGTKVVHMLDSVCANAVRSLVDTIGGMC